MLNLLLTFSLRNELVFVAIFKSEEETRTSLLLLQLQDKLINRELLIPLLAKMGNVSGARVKYVCFSSTATV